MSQNNGLINRAYGYKTRASISGTRTYPTGPNCSKNDLTSVLHVRKGFLGVITLVTCLEIVLILNML